MARCKQRAPQARTTADWLFEGGLQRDRPRGGTHLVVLPQQQPDLERIAIRARSEARLVEDRSQSLRLQLLINRRALDLQRGLQVVERLALLLARPLALERGLPLVEHRGQRATRRAQAVRGGRQTN